jgi:hypothetical protein
VKRAKSIYWYDPPRSSGAWLRAVIDYAIEHQPHFRSGERAASSGWDMGARAHFVLSLCSAALKWDTGPEVERLRLWLREGWVPPELPPGA